MPVTRFPFGVGTLNPDAPATLGDPSHQQFIIDLPLVASIAAQGTGIFMPDYSMAHATIVRIISRAPQALATISVGTGNDANQLTGGGSMGIGTQTTRVYEAFNLPDVAPLADRNTGIGEEITYMFSADDLTEWVGQILVVSVVWGEQA